MAEFFFEFITPYRINYISDLCVVGSHEHESNRSGNKLVAAFFINLVFTIIELIGGLLTNSLAILSDAVHDFGDSLSLGLAWYLEKVSRRSANKKFTYGYRRFSVLGATINSLILIIGAVLIIRESIPRIMEPEISDAQGMILLSVLGIVFNGAAVLRMRGGKSLNERVVSLHLLEDVLGWIVVLVGALIMQQTGILWIDPILSLGISTYIGYKAYLNLRKALRIIMQAVPEDQEVEKLAGIIQSVDGVCDVHDIRVWSLDGERNILSAHVVVPDNYSSTDMVEVKNRVHASLSQAGMTHSTIELETESEVCREVTDELTSRN